VKATLRMSLARDARTNMSAWGRPSAKAASLVSDVLSKCSVRFSLRQAVLRISALQVELESLIPARGTKVHVK
jgi:hypothetical protein